VTAFGKVAGMASLVRVRWLTEQEGQKLQRIVRRGSTSSVRLRRAMMLLASSGGSPVPAIAQLVQADEDTVRDVIHRFNEIGLACLDPRWAGGRPRLLSIGPVDGRTVDVDAATRPLTICTPCALSRRTVPWTCLSAAVSCLRTQDVSRSTVPGLTLAGLDLHDDTTSGVESHVQSQPIRFQLSAASRAHPGAA